jgi:tellurite methyltransferase
VTAIDLTAEGLQRLRTVAGPDPRLTTIQAAMEDAEWPQPDLVNASRALPFCAPDRFDELWVRIVASLPAGGRFAGHLFGPRLSWASEVVTHTKDAAMNLFAGFDIERFDEREGDGTGPLGRPQHTHALLIVARKR